MNITIFNEKDRTTTTLDFDKSTVEDLLTHLNINSETVLVARNAEILLPTDSIVDGDIIIFLSVISGG